MRSSSLSRQGLISLSMQYGRQHLAIQCIIVKQKGVWPNAPRMEALQKISPHMAGSTSTAPIQSPSFSCKGSIIVIYSAFLIFLAKKIPPGQNRGLYIHIYFNTCICHDNGRRSLTEIVLVCQLKLSTIDEINCLIWFKGILTLTFKFTVTFIPQGGRGGGCNPTTRI